ncbi:MAG TPA: LLM class flavin-dependent oxidoreductase [Limnochordales bacterium]
MAAVNLSVLDLVPIGTGSSSRQALVQMVELALLAEELGYTRFWLAEHHGMPSIASSAPEILIARVASATRRIRVGAGGIMLPNHAPLRVAEAFHTLAALFPGRIDLGIGRAPGTDPVTSAALRPFDAAQFPTQLQELLALSRRAFPPDHPFHGVRVVPDDVELPPVWVLGSSGATAELAGRLGLGYGFASHFSFDPPGPAIEAYRRAFRPSAQFPRPHVIVGAAVFCAPTDEEADYLARSMDLAWVRLRRGQVGRLPSPEEAAAYPFSEEERFIVAQHRSLAIWGDPARVRERLLQLAEATGADEIIISSMIHDHAARLRSYRLVMEAFSGS